MLTLLLNKSITINKDAIKRTIRRATMTQTTLDYNLEVINFLKLNEILDKNTQYNCLYADEILGMNQVDEFGIFRSIIVAFNSKDIMNATKDEVYDLYEMFQSYVNNKITKQEKIIINNGETTMTNTQIKWASQHDWFIEANHDTITVMDSGLGVVETFTNFKELTIWAGY